MSRRWVFSRMEALLLLFLERIFSAIFYIAISKDRSDTFFLNILNNVSVVMSVKLNAGTIRKYN